MRIALILLFLANVIVLAAGWYVADPLRVPRDPRAQEIEPQRVRIVPAAELRHAGTPRACLEWGAFLQADLPRAERAIETSGLNLRIGERRGEGVAGSWWVYVPPPANRRAADRIAEDLRRNGLADYYVVQEAGAFQNAVSLGLFSTEAAATARREQVLRLGLREVSIQSRDNSGGAARVWVRLRDVPGTAIARLQTLRADFPGSEIRDCG